MSIFRVVKDKNNPYLIMHKHGLQDENLSWKAKGILAYLLSLPDDWQIYESEIQQHARDGKDSLAAGIKELIQNKYIHRSRARDEKGRLREYEYQVFEVPTYSGFSNVGLPNVGESATTINNSINNDIKNNDYNNKPSFFDSLLGIWERQYQIKTGKGPTVTDAERQLLSDLIDKGASEMEFHKVVKEYLGYKRRDYSLECMINSSA